MLSNDFELINTFENEIFNKYEYYDSNNHYIFFTQTVKNVYNVNFDNENGELNYLSIGNSDGYIVDLGNNEYLITWDDGEYVFDIIGNIDQKQLIELAESVHKAE